jgi:hypothetical protein
VASTPSIESIIAHRSENSSFDDSKPGRRVCLLANDYCISRRVLRVTHMKWWRLVMISAFRSKTTIHQQ